MFDEAPPFTIFQHAHCKSRGMKFNRWRTRNRILRSIGLGAMALSPITVYCAAPGLDRSDIPALREGLLLEALQLLTPSSAHARERRSRDSSRRDRGREDRDEGRSERRESRESDRSDGEEASRQSQDSDREEASRQSQDRDREEAQGTESSEGDRSSARKAKASDTTKYRKKSDDDGPPKTVEEVIRRLVGKTAPVPHPKLPEFRDSEVVAADLSSRSLERARQLGFKVEDSAGLSNIGVSLTRLIAPSGLDAHAARDLLRQELPSGAFSFNNLHRIYQSADLHEQEAADKTAADGAAAGRACGAERCFGRTVVGWQAPLTTCARGTRVGIIDTSVDLEHPSFKGRRIKVGNFLGREALSQHDWHGTAILSLLAGDVRGSTPGLIPEAEFFVASAFRTDEDGNASTDTLSLLRAIDWMDAWDVKLINMSFSGPRDELIEKAIERLHRKGVIFVAAAGNEGPTAPPSYPAAYGEVIAVTAVSKDLRNYRHANRGTYLDLSAPGVEIWTALPGGKEGYRSGTSFAAPFVTGILATVVDGREGAHDEGELLKLLSVRDLGPPGFDPIYGRGLIVAPSACRKAGNAVVSQRSTGWPTQISTGSTAAAH